MNLMICTLVFVWYVTTRVWCVRMCIKLNIIVVREIPFCSYPVYTPGVVRHMCRSGSEEHAGLVATWGWGFLRLRMINGETTL